MTDTSHGIADIERDTGLSKDTLRVWERRYGFPHPERDTLGERRYDDNQLLRLRHLRRLLDAGYRAGQVVPLPLEELLNLQTVPAGRLKTAGRLAGRSASGLTEASTGSGHEKSRASVAQWMSKLRRHEAQALRADFEDYLQRHGLAALMIDGIAPMNALVGQSWLEGRLAIFEEHLYSEVVQQVLRHALIGLATNRTAQPPRVLLTTVPGEVHGLGLLMAECMMALEGCDTVALGVQTPLADIVSAARACRADVVALGFSAALNPRDVRAALTRLRMQLPPELALWTGGQCPALSNPGRGRAGNGSPGHQHLASLEDIPPAVAGWRVSHGTVHATGPSPA